jgi:hypothetical protein
MEKFEGALNNTTRVDYGHAVRELTATARAARAARTAALAPEPGPGIDQPAWRAHLLAARPTGLTTGYWHGVGTAIGFGDPTGLAMVAADGRWIRDGTAAVTAAAAGWVAAWEQAGRPGWERLRPTIIGSHPDLLPVRLLTGGAIGSLLEI